MSDDDYKRRQRLTENVLGDAGWAVAEILDLRAERDALQAKLDAIDALHRKVIHMTNGVDFTTCPTCDENTYGRWPCDTARILHPEGDTPT